MIKSFSDKATRALYEGGDPKAFRAFKAQAERKLQMLDSVAKAITNSIIPLIRINAH